MSDPVQMSSLDLAALLCSRVCHDIISPVGAVINGLEVLDEEDGAEMKDFALDLIRKSANQASAKLQFARLAFGAAGSAGAEIDLSDAEKVAQGYIAGEKADLTWESPRALMPKNRVKLLLNMVLLGISAVPRGGEIKLAVTGAANEARFQLSCSGTGARVPPAFEKLVPGDLGEEPVDAHAIQPVYTGMLARDCQMKLTAWTEGDKVILSADPVV